MSGSGGSPASGGRDAFGFDLAGGVENNPDDLEPGDDELDDEELDDLDDDEDEDDDDLIDDELIDLDDEYDEGEEEDKPHPGHRYDE